jgi:hypothetical protein
MSRSRQGREIGRGGGAGGAGGECCRYRCSAPDCAGFPVGRKQGVRSAYTVRIRDPRINWLVPLMCVVYIAEQLSGDVRQGLANMASDPFKI